MSAPISSLPPVSFAAATPRVRFDRREFAGAFGDIGTSLPIIVALLAATDLNAAGVLLAFGFAQISTGLLYGLPMPVQPLKAMAVIAIAGQAPGGLLPLAGLMIGALMLALSATGALDWLSRAIPHCVVRGLQAGLGLMLAGTALGLVGREDRAWGWAAACIAVAVLLLLRKNRRLPGALLVVGAALLWTAAFRLDWTALVDGVGFVAPRPSAWPLGQWLTALTLLVLPQLPLSLGNSVIATR